MITNYPEKKLFLLLLSTYILFNYWSPLNQTEITRGPSHKMIPEGAPLLKTVYEKSL